MNFGTKLRTILRIAASANTAIYAVTAAIDNLNSPTFTLIWTIITIASDFVIAFLTTYFNNDYTPIAAEKTGEMRLIKAQEKGIDGEDFFDSFEDYEEEEEEEEGEEF